MFPNVRIREHKVHGSLSPEEYPSWQPSCTEARHAQSARGSRYDDRRSHRKGVPVTIVPAAVSPKKGRLPENFAKDEAEMPGEFIDQVAFPFRTRRSEGVSTGNA